MADAPKRLTAADFPSAGAAADHAHDAAAIAHDVALVITLALAADTGLLTPETQEAVRTVAIYGADKAREARNAIDLTRGMIRTGGRHA